MELKLDTLNYYRSSDMNYLKEKNNLDYDNMKVKIISNKINENYSINNLKNISDLGNISLSILQDFESNRFVYRQIDHKTNSVKNQYPNESELARIAFLNKIEEVALKKIKKENKA